MPVNPISMTAPTDWSAQLQEIERRRKLAELLQQQSMAPEGQQSVNGIPVANSWTQGLAKLVQAYMGQKGQTDANTQQRQLGSDYLSSMQDTLSKALQAGSGTPARPDIPVPSDEAGGGPGMIAQPAIAPDRARMAALLMGHPATQAMGMQQLGNQMNMEQLTAALGPKQPSTTTPGIQPNTGESGASLTDGLPPIGLLGAGDMGKTVFQTLAERNKPVNVRPGGTVYIPGQGPQYTAPVNGQQIKNGPTGPTMSIVPGAEQTLGALAEVKPKAEMSYSMQLMDVPVYLPGGDQTSVKMNATQAHQYQTTGQLPPEIAASIPQLRQPSSAEQPQIVPNDAQALKTAQSLMGKGPFGVATGKFDPNSAPKDNQGNAVVGRTQTQSEQIAQTGQTESVKKINEGQAKIFSDHYESSLRGVQALPMISAARQAIESGAVTGYGANFVGGLNRILSAAGFQGGKDATENTQVFAATTARQVLNIIKNLGSGSGISDADREYAAKIVGGDISLDANSIKRLLDISDTAIRNDAKWVNDQVPAYQRIGAIVQPINVDQFAGTMQKGTPAPVAVGMPFSQSDIDAELRRRGRK